MDTHTSVLLALANCYRCYGVNGISQLIKLGLLVQIATSLNPMADTSPQTLLQNAKCYNCHGYADIGTLLELGLLQSIAGSAGTAGGSSGTGSPTAATPGVFYFKTSDSTIWANNNGTWQQID